MRRLKSLAIFLLLGLCACATSGANVPPPQMPLGAASYYLEIHGRQSNVWLGHTYIVYGAQDVFGKPAAREVTGFYPGLGYAGMLLTPFAVPGVVGKQTDDDGGLPDRSYYRRWITAADYERLLQYIASAIATTHLFNIFTNNCNDFAAGAAKTIGLRVPSNRFSLPEVFIADLVKLNGLSAPLPPTRVAPAVLQGSQSPPANSLGTQSPSGSGGLLRSAN
jgi:hypothetical protein